MAPVASSSVRFASVDALRGAVVGLMIFVNSLGGMSGVPGWTQHLPSETDGYTVTDMVFPWFLFIVGVAIPLSLGAKAALPFAARFAALGRILPRVLGLVLLGLIYVNGDRFDAAATGMSRSAWTALALTAACVLWGAFPRPDTPGWRRAESAWKFFAAVALACLLVIWKGEPRDGNVWFERSWWGILGLIGWSYLVCSIVYLLAGGSATALM